MKELLLQIKQRTEKLLEEVEKLENLEFKYHTTCTISDHSVVKDQKELIEFLTMKLNTTVVMLGKVWGVSYEKLIKIKGREEYISISWI